MPELGTVDAVFLQPGELFAAGGAVRVKTVVGSCLAITVRAPRLRLAAMAHCLLPTAQVPVRSVPLEEAARYVDAALDLMLRVLAGHGAAHAELEIKIFGGADAFESGYDVGSRNIETALAMIAARGLKLTASVVGGRRGRVLEFETETGAVLVKTLPEQGSRRDEARL